MDKDLTKLHKNVKNLSPISGAKNNLKLKEELLKSENKKNLTSSTKLMDEIKSKGTKSLKNIQSSKIENNLHERINQNQNQKSEEDSKFKYAKNINEYRHLMSDTQTGDSQMAWILDLRAVVKNKNNLRTIPDVHPRFYANEIDKFKKKTQDSREMDRKSLLSAGGNSNRIEHLVKERLGGTANISQYGFETTLRSFRPLTNETKQLNNSDWKGASFIHKPRLFSSYISNMPSYQTTQNKFLTISNFNSTVKTFEPVYDEVLIGNQVVKRKKLKPSSTLQDFLGEHEGLDKYNDNYNKIKNINDIRHILSKHTNSVAKFELGLRNYSEKIKKVATDRKVSN